MLEEPGDPPQSRGLVHRTISRRLFGRVIHCLFIVGLLALGLYAAVWSMRPVWHTHIFHYGTPSEFSLAVQYPDGWHLEESSNDWDDAAGILTPNAPSGLSGWWAKYVLKLDMNAWRDDKIMVELEKPTIAMASDFDVAQRYARSQNLLVGAFRRTYKSVTSTSINQDGVKGFDIEAHQALRPALNKNCMRYLLFYADQAGNNLKLNRPILYGLQIRMAEENYRSLKPTINEIIRRLRLVEYNRVSPLN